MSQMEALRQAVALSPTNVPLLMLLGQACLEELLPDEARTAYDHVLKLEPSNLAAKLGVVRSLVMLGKNSEAIVRTESLAAAHPGEAEIFLLLSRILAGEGNPESARESYRKARDLGAMADAGLEKTLFPSSASTSPKARVAQTPSSWEPEDATAQAQHAPALGECERPTTGFNDVGGMDAVKEEIRMKILYPLNNAELFKAYGKKIGGGVLLYGPPGCGKTMLSRATAGEIKANFLSIGLHQILDMYIGNSEKNLHQFFQLARDHAPCVLFFDEVDALAADRSDMRKSAGRTLINQFLAEMDGTAGSNEGLLILGATNAPWHIDPAFRRPGRFDRVLFVPPPDEIARARIIEVMAQNKPVAELDAKALARKTKDFSGADLKAVFDQTIERCLASAMKEGRVVPLTTQSLIEAARSTKPSTREWFESARNYALYSNQSGFYDDVLTFLGIKK